MDILRSWVYVDDTNNIWKFSVNSVKELQYSIMYKEGKWTKEKPIAQDVLGYYIYADKMGVHILYCNTKAELKYCTLIEHQWMGKTLYKLDSNKVEIKNLNAIVVNGEVHIFYLLRDKKSNGHGILMHCKWNGIETSVNKLQDIILLSDLNDHYLVYLDERNNIEMLFLSDEGNEVSLNHCSFKNRRWTNAIRLYGIAGNEIEIKILKDQYGLHLLNKCNENLINYLVHVFVKKNGDIYKSNVHESNSTLSELVFLKEDNKIYSYWVENNKIYSSFFRGEDWSNPICVTENNEHDIKKYNYIGFDKDNITNTKEVYWVGEDLNLIIFGDAVRKDKEKLNINEIEEIQEKQKIINTEEVFKKDDDIKKIRMFSALRSEIKLMKETIVSLKLQLQNKQSILDEYEEQISKAIHYKQKAEDNYNIFIEVQKKLQNELEELKRLYAEEKVNRENAEIKLKEMEEEKINIKEQVNRIIEEKDKLTEDNEKLIEEKNKLIEDNDILNNELENIKNKSSAKGFWKF